MAFPQVTIDNFRYNWLNLGIGNESAELRRFESYRDRFLPRFRRELLGQKTYSKIESVPIADPLPAKWDDLLNGSSFTDKDENQYYQAGTEEVILGMLYFEFVRDNFITSHTGKVRNKNENSERLSPAEIAMVAQSRYNEVIIDYNDHTLHFLRVWTDREVAISSITAPVAPSTIWTIATNSTKYLADGDTVKIAEIEVVVQNIVANTSFEVDYAGGSLNADAYVFSPFEGVPRFYRKLTMPV